VGINFGIGFVTGGLGKYLSGASVMARFLGASQRFAQRLFANTTAQRIIAKALYYGGSALVGAVGSAAAKVASNWVERDFYGHKDVSLFDGVGAAFATGFAMGVASSYWGASGSDKVWQKYDKLVYKVEQPIAGINYPKDVYTSLFQKNATNELANAVGGTWDKVARTNPFNAFAAAKK
jgi:hypothetical protein